MAETSPFRIVTIPPINKDGNQDERDIASVQKFRELRLRSLRLAPDAFASNYEAESKRGLEHTFERLSNPKAIHFVAIRYADETVFDYDESKDEYEQLERILASDWLGLIVLLGPEEDTAEAVSADQDPFLRMTSAERAKHITDNSQPLTESPSSLHYHLNGMFVDPNAQRCGLGLGLVNAALERGQREASKVKAALRVTIAVYKHNVAAMGLYEKAGFEVVDERPSKSRPENVAVNMELTIPAVSSEPSQVTAEEDV